jgi:hypothetical protein
VSILDHLATAAGCLGQGDTPKDASPTETVCMGAAGIAFSLLFFLFAPDEHKVAGRVLGTAVVAISIGVLVLGIARTAMC